LSQIDRYTLLGHKRFNAILEEFKMVSFEKLHMYVEVIGLTRPLNRRLPGPLNSKAKAFTSL
jgi:hypothetical protein